LSIDVTKLGKTLSDDTRVKILQVLKAKGPTSYVDLMEALGITNTGQLNYHLKVLGDLIKKEGPDGKYDLTEKGAVALDFLDKFKTLTMGTGTGFSIEPTPYERTARAFQAFLSLEILAVVFVNVYAFLVSPASVPLHYDFDGQALSSAPRTIFLLLAAVLSIPQGVFLLLSRARYRLVNMYPFAINLPAFRASLAKMDYEKRGYWINRLFSEILVVGSVTGVMMIFLAVSIYESTVSESGISASAVVLTLTVVGIAAITLAYRALGYPGRMTAETKGAAGEAGGYTRGTGA
jgi:DNA-binding transcriptional ArsR family regulator